MASGFSLTVEHGAPAYREVDIAWADDSPRSIAGSVPVLTVYSGLSDSTAPLFVVTGRVDATVLSRATFQIAADQTAQPRASYYATIDITNGSGTIMVDGRWHGQLVVSGR